MAAKTFRLTKGARDQLAILLEHGAASATTGKAKSDRGCSDLNPVTLGGLRKKKLVDSTVIKTRQRQYTVYWLTPKGATAWRESAQAAKAKAEKPAKEKAAPKPLAELLDERDARRTVAGHRIRVADKIKTPGFYRMSSAVYHADPCPTPALSTGLAHTLVTQSPAHAWHESPRGGNAGATSTTTAMDVGSAVHALCFGDPADVVLIDAPDWRGDRTRGWRAAVRQEGRVPVLKGDYPRIKAIAERLTPVIEAEIGGPLVKAGRIHVGEPLVKGLNAGCIHGEIVIAAKEAGGDNYGGWRRTRVDLLRGDALVALDVKTTDATAEPEATARRLFDQGAHIQDALTMRILDALDPANVGRRRFKFICIEQSEPFGISVIEIDPMAREIAAQQTDYACDLWDRCVASGEWPGFQRGTHRATMPAYAAIAWRARAFALGLTDYDGVVQ